MRTRVSDMFLSIFSSRIRFAFCPLCENIVSLYGQIDWSQALGTQEFHYNAQSARGRENRKFPMEEKKSHESVRAVERALEILLAFRPGDEELSVAELLTRVDLSRPTLYRLLNTLEQQGFLFSFGEPQRFRLGS